jgi:hypothetical protein
MIREKQRHGLSDDEISAGWHCLRDYQGAHTPHSLYLLVDWHCLRDYQGTHTPHSLYLLVDLCVLRQLATLAKGHLLSFQWRNYLTYTNLRSYR